MWLVSPQCRSASSPLSTLQGCGEVRAPSTRHLGLSSPLLHSGRRRVGRWTRRSGRRVWSSSASRAEPGPLSCSLSETHEPAGESRPSNLLTLCGAWTVGPGREGSVGGRLQAPTHSRPQGSARPGERPRWPQRVGAEAPLGSPVLPGEASLSGGDCRYRAGVASALQGLGPRRRVCHRCRVLLQSPFLYRCLFSLF